MRMENERELILAIYHKPPVTYVLLRLTKEDPRSITVTNTQLLAQDDRID